MPTQTTNTHHADSLAVLERDLSRRSVLAIRTAFGVSGVVALGLGIVLLAWPTRTMAVLTATLAIYFLVAGGIRVLAGIFDWTTPVGHRLLNIVLGLLLFAAGAIALKNVGASAAALLVLTVVVIGVGWVVDGVISITESRSASSPAWAVAFGVLNVVAGLVVIAVPTWSAFWLMLVCGATLVALGAISLIRAFTFARGETVHVVRTGHRGL